VFLAGITTIWLRDHNNLAHGLKTVNPYWSDNRLWDETRKILTAVYQNIVYGEFLPALIGEDLAKLYNLLPLESGFVHEYDDSIYAQTINEVATAAFRYGHTVISATHSSAGTKYQFKTERPISYYLFNYHEYANNVNDAVRGTLMDWSYAPDSQITSDLNDWLFKGLFWGDSWQWSLAALNIQRGRDHGLQPYNKYRKLCGLKEAYSFEEFDNIPEYTINQLKELYASPDDVDLFVGLFSEYPLPGAMLGATAGCKNRLNSFNISIHIIQRKFYLITNRSCC
jgi:peroxidase